MSRDPGSFEPGRVGGDGTIELRLGTGVAAGGDGIGRLPDGRVVFVEGGLPGERIAVEVREDHRDYARGRLLRVLDPSPDRVAPPCPWVEAGCGGCGWQHARPSAQLVMKGGVVIDALRRIAHVDAVPVLGPPVAQPFENYRTTVHLGVDGAGRPAYRQRHRHDLVAVRGCSVVHPRLAELIEEVRVPAAAGVTLRVGVAGGERLVIVEARAGTSGRPRRARRGPGRPKGSVDGPGAWSRPVTAPPDAVVVGPGGSGAFNEEVGGHRWRVSARSFFQAGPGGAEALVALVDGAVGPMAFGEHLVDLYAGVGVLGGVAVSRRAGVSLTAVESDVSAVADARHNLADLAATVVDGEVGAWVATPAAVVIADPARPGLARPGVAAVVATQCRRLVLVSCDPASLARDTSLLAAAGYRLGGLRIIDLFPHTPHIETVAQFELG